MEILEYAHGNQILSEKSEVHHLHYLTVFGPLVQVRENHTSHNRPIVVLMLLTILLIFSWYPPARLSGRFVAQCTGTYVDQQWQIHGQHAVVDGRRALSPSVENAYVWLAVVCDDG